MDIAAGILGTAAFLAGLYALIVHVARGNRSTAGGRAWLAAVACMIAGAALIFVGWRLHVDMAQPGGAAPVPQTGGPPLASAPSAGEISPASAVALVVAIAAAFSLAYWLFLCLIPDRLAKRRAAR